MLTVSPRSGDCFYMRMLLCYRRGPTSHEDLRTVNGVVHPKFKSAALVLGFLENDEEWLTCMREATETATPYELRTLFVSILIHCEPADARGLWNKFEDEMRQDFHRMYPDDSQKSTAFAIQALSRCLESNGSSLDRFQELPQLAQFEQYFALEETNRGHQSNRLVAMESSHNQEQIQGILEGKSTMTEEHEVFYNDVMSEITKESNVRRGKVYFLEGEGGSGKTFISNILLAQVRSMNKIALAVASSGLAALNLIGGTTAHSRFCLPRSLHEHSRCDVRKQSHLAELLRLTELIIWDECSMMHKYAVEAVDHMLQDLMDNALPFGGKVVIFSGDFKQILPVILKGTPGLILEACLKNSYLWSNVAKFHLTVNMRLTNNNSESVREFAGLLKSIGHGTYPTCTELGADYIRLPDDLAIPYNSPDDLGSFLHSVYQDMNNLRINELKSYFGCRAILAPKHSVVADINTTLLERLTSDGEMTYLSADSVAEKGNSDSDACEFPIEFLNSIDINNFPSHKLHLKVGCPIILLRNLCTSEGMCNGTRLIVLELKTRCIKAQIMNGSHKNKIVYIPRTTTIHDGEQNNYPFELRRRQFPVQVAFAMTIHKAQGQTISHVGVYLPEPVFSHGQLYVAMSRAQAKGNIKFLVANGQYEGLPGIYTKNVVYQEALE
ncbi:hypothetical protein Ae201684P_019682 [Aphanomyces euteiches]|nr:hypothetical protein Ae201684P_019331 [Aphanomyces euteiches]KAH9078602.1 hypothetical protein Ae201684P_019682 [Aphanomyces euteiches]